MAEMDCGARLRFPNGDIKTSNYGKGTFNFIQRSFNFSENLLFRLYCCIFFFYFQFIFEKWLRFFAIAKVNTVWSKNRGLVSSALYLYISPWFFGLTRNRLFRLLDGREINSNINKSKICVVIVEICVHLLDFLVIIYCFSF